MLSRASRPSSFLASGTFVASAVFAFVLVVGWCIPGAATLGTFQGKVVEASSAESGTYIYVQARNGRMRRVNIKRAKVVFASNVVPGQKANRPEAYLEDGAEVRVTAEQGAGGEWEAKEITILRLGHERRHDGEAQAALPA